MAITPLEEVLGRARAATQPGESSATAALQRVCVRLLFDPSFVARSYDGSGEEIEELGIPRPLVEQLLAQDRRVWNADHLRRRRALKVLMEEFRISTALFLAEGRRLAFLDAFFSSPQFHDSVQQRAYMALAFLDYLATALRDGRYNAEATAAVLALEGGMAVARRAARSGGGPDQRTAGETPKLELLPGRLSLGLPGGTLGVVQHMEQWLFEQGLIPAQALCEDLPRPEPLPTLDARNAEFWLLEPASDQKVELVGIEKDYHHVISACAQRRSRSELERMMRPFGLASRAWALAEALIEGGVLRLG